MAKKRANLEGYLAKIEIRCAIDLPHKSPYFLIFPTDVTSSRTLSLKARLLPSNKSILFVNPDFQCSFFLKDQFRQIGWKADVYKQSGYPEDLLYSKDYITEKAIFRDIGIGGVANRIIFFLKLIFGYKYFLVYGSPEVFLVFRNKDSYTIYRRSSPELAILKFLRKKIISFPTGCLEEVLARDFSEHENGRVCRNCGYEQSLCNDEKNARSFRLRNKYFDFHIANTPIPSKRVNKKMVRYKSLELDEYHPHIEIPKQFKLPVSQGVRVFHSFYDKHRLHDGKNIKGSPHIVAAIDRLQSEGYPVEYHYLKDIPARYMRYYQVQADIVVDQLIYGWWGSTAIEAMALGKAVVCYLTPLWKQLFLEKYSEYDCLPIIEANTENIYDVLKRLVTDKEHREKKGAESRLFAEKHFDVKKNVLELERLFLNL